MVKKLLYGFLAILLSFSFIYATGGNVLAVKAEKQMIRIGVVPSSDSITIGSEAEFQVKDKVTGELLYSGTDSELDVKLSSSAEITTNFMLQTAWTSSNAAVQDWLNRAQIGGYETYVEPYNDGYRLFIGEFPADASWSVRSDFREKVIADGLAGNDSFWKVITIASGESQITLVGDGIEKTVSNPVVIQSSNDLVTIDGNQYRGIGEVAFNSGGTLAGINELPLEHYLYGVVPRELPPTVYGKLEAQKAQAVAARTYAIKGLGKRSADGYDLLPTTSDQVYGGYEVEHPISTKAVNETKGVVATYEGGLITAVYHSTSGGYTANNEDVWSTAPVPYLRGVPDAQRGEAIKHVPTLEVFKNSSNLTSLRATKNGDFESDWSSYHRWNYTWTNREISEVLSTYYDTEVGKVKEINVLERSNSGRVLEIEFVTENGTFYEQKDRVRWALKYYNANGYQSVLRSTFFYIEPVVDSKTKELTGFEVYGGGWGHGVGLSQTGAVGMAVKGKTYDQILKHYYQGIDLEKLY